MAEERLVAELRDLVADADVAQDELAAILGSVFQHGWIPGDLNAVFWVTRTTNLPSA